MSEQDSGNKRCGPKFKSTFLLRQTVSFLNKFLSWLRKASNRNTKLALPPKRMNNAPKVRRWNNALPGYSKGSTLDIVQTRPIVSTSPGLEVNSNDAISIPTPPEVWQEVIRVQPKVFAEFERDIWVGAPGDERLVDGFDTIFEDDGAKRARSWPAFGINVVGDKIPGSIDQREEQQDREEFSSHVSLDLNQIFDKKRYEK
ncbi:MAG: hypothetical protein Q9192_001553 [Flavoplaca navasiana]